MMFARQLRPRIASGEIDCTVRFWHHPRVKVGGVYHIGEGHVCVTSLREISSSEITEALARRSGFEGIEDLLATARHGSGENIYMIEFVYQDRGEPKDPLW